jgi:hypothetical protein
MNDQPSIYDAVIADLRAYREQIDQAIQVLESLRKGAAPLGMLGVPPPGGVPSLLGSGPAQNGEIPHGTFHRMSIEAAVKKLLEMRKRTMNAQEIVAALREGGLQLQSETPANTVTSVLTRSFNGGSNIVRVSRGLWGLQEWYPNQRFARRGSED